jgi:hypothetical protein
MEGKMTDFTGKQIEFSEVKQTYNGRNHACCCGCSGKHTYPSHTPPAEGWQGMVNDRIVRGALAKVNHALLEGGASLEVSDSYISVENESGTRVTIVYLS